METVTWPTTLTIWQSAPSTIRATWSWCSSAQLRQEALPIANPQLERAAIRLAVTLNSADKHTDIERLPNVLAWPLQRYQSVSHGDGTAMPSGRTRPAAIGRLHQKPSCRQPVACPTLYSGQPTGCDLGGRNQFSLGT
jgi:hypothetical protein